jgi:hypothetical protein
MTLIVEDGSARPDSESYASISQIDAYHAARGNSKWDLLTIDEKEQAARRATDYLLQMYRTKWKGLRANLNQALDWPRLQVQLEDVGFGRLPYYVPYNTVPQQVINATAEMALRAAAGELAPDLQRTVAEKTIGPIKTVYAAGAPEYVRFRSVDLLLRPLLQAGGMGMRLVRA